MSIKLRSFGGVPQITIVFSLCLFLSAQAAWGAGDVKEADVVSGTERVEWGRAFDFKKRTEISVGVTTLSETEEMIGDPWIRGFQGGHRVFSWETGLEVYDWVAGSRIDAVASVLASIQSISSGLRVGSWDRAVAAADRNVEVLRHRRLFLRERRLSKLKVLFDRFDDGRFVVVDWNFTHQTTDGESIFESASNRVKNRPQIDKSTNDLDSMTDDEFIRKLERDLNGAGISDEAVRKQLIKDAMRRRKKK